MQTTLNRLMSPARSLTFTSLALLSVLALCLSGAVAHAQLPIVVSGPPSQLGALTGGGWDGSQEPVGGTFVIGANGNVLVGDGYTSNFLQITPSGTDTVLGAGVGASNAALDSYGNVYFGGNYNPNIIKLPYNAATGAYVGFTTAPTTNCLGGNQDTAPCIFAPSAVAYMSGTLAGGGASGYAGMVFDGQGNFFFESNTLPATDANTIFECNLACLASTTATPTLIYKDANPIGALQIDPWGNLFFVDGNNSTNKVTNLNEVPLVSGSYAATATVVLSYTNKAGYGNGISGLAIAGNGTIYFSTNGDGIFALPNTQAGGPTVSGIYMLSTQGGKGVAIDSKGNLYGIPYNNGDVVSFIPVGSFALGSVALGGTATTATVNIFDNAATSTPTLSESAFEFGKSTTEFSITAGANGGAELGTGNGTFSPALSLTGAMASATVTFNPKGVGERNAAFVISDSANSASGTAMLSGVGLGAAGNLDPGVWTTYGSGFTTPYSVSVDAAGDMAVADEGAGKVFWIPAGSAAGTTPTAIGTGFVEPAATAFDANGNLYIADFSNDNVVEIPNVGGALAPASQSTLIPSTMVFNGTALSKPSGLGVGPDGTLYIADLGNSRVVSYNLVTGQTAVPFTGLKNPWGVAVDSSNNVYIADTGKGNVLVDIAGVQSTLTVPGVNAPWGVVVDPSGSLIVSDHATGNIVWVPNPSGTLTTANAVLIEKNPSSALGIALDAAGDLFTTDATAKAAYAIQRTAAAINLGTVQNGVTNSGNIYLESAGNATATLASPDVTQATNTMFTLVPAASNGCTSGSSGAPGNSCQFTATFAPPPGTANGPQSGTAMVDIATPAIAYNVNMSGTATQSSILPQTITGFNPSPTLLAGQQITLSATGGASGNPVVFSIDPSSACTSCATTSGTNGATLTAISAGTVTVDANQAAGQANGNQYAAATTVKVNITIQLPTTTGGEPSIVATEPIQIGSLGAAGEGWDGGQSPLGGSFVVGLNGHVIVGGGYGGTTLDINPTTQTQSAIAPLGGAAAAIDSYGNIYIANDAYYSGLNTAFVYKLPYNATTQQYVGFTTAPTTVCNAGGSQVVENTDTAPCEFAPSQVQSGLSKATGYVAPGIADLAFDAQGNFFFSTDTQTGNDSPNTIYECNLACLGSSSGAPKLLYADPGNMGAMAIDPWGNIFFVDGSQGSGNVTKLQELPLVSGTYATSPTTVLSYTSKQGNNGLSGVTVASNGTIYFASNNDGIYAIPNTQSGGPKPAGTYAASTVSGKAVALDSMGNLYQIPYNGGDVVDFIGVNNLIATAAPIDGSSTTNVTLIDNVENCISASNPLPIIVATKNGNPTSIFSGAVSGSCAAPLGTTNGTFSPALTITGAAVPATINFNPTGPGAISATLTISDPVNGGLGTATITGTGQETPQTVAFTAPTTTTYTYAPGMTITVSATNGGSNNPVTFTVDSSSSGTGTFSATTVTGTTSTATLTVTQAGSIVIDANELGGFVNNVYYDPATQVQKKLTINQAAQAIVFPQPLSPVNFAANPSTTVTLSANGGGSGNAVAFSVDPSSTGTGTVSASTVANGTSTATLTVTGAGNIVVDANQAANADYAAAPQVQQTIVVNQATQTITFTPLTQPFYYIATGVTLSISATGGGSNSAIVFTVDSKSTMKGSFSVSTVKGAVSTATLTMPAGQTPTTGTIIVDANQPGNTNYLAATQTQFTINVGTPLPTQTITFNQPQTQVAGTSSKASTLALTATASSGFPVTYTSSTPTVCTVSGSTATFLASVTTASTCTIVASQPGDNQYFAPAVPVTVTFAVDPAGQTPSMSMSLSIPSLTIQRGTVGLTQITLNSANNFAAAQVAFTCTGLPSGYACTFNPATVTAFAPSSTTGMPTGPIATTTLTVTPPVQIAAARPDFRPLFPATLAVAFCFLGFKKRRRLQLLLLLVVLFAGLGLITSCGGTSSGTKTTTTSQGTITATGGGSSITSSLTVTLQ